MAIFGLGSQVDQIQKAIDSGEPAEIASVIRRGYSKIFRLY